MTAGVALRLSPEWRRTLAWLAVAAALFVAAWLAPVPRTLFGLTVYLPLHSAMEVFAIVVAMLVFDLVWSTQRTDQPQNLVLLCFAFLAVGLLDFVHMMSYPGMPGLYAPGSVQTAITYWLAARLAAALGLLLLVAWPARPLTSGAARPALLVAMLLAVTGVVAVVELRPHWLPAMLVPGRGLTPFKIGAEYLVIALHLLAAVLIVRRGAALIVDARRLFMVLAVLSLSELCFTLYSEVTDLFNILGHVYKVIGYYLLYRLVFVETVRRPFEDLRRSREALRDSERRYAELIEHAPDAMIMIDPDGILLAANPAKERLSGYRAAELVGRHFAELGCLAPASLAPALEEFRRILAGEARPPVELELQHRDGTGVHVEAKSTLVRRNGRVAGIQVVMRDISERKRAEERLNYLAYYDTLTGLPNRALLEDRLLQTLVECRRHGRVAAVVFLDLDRFKFINDSLGHSAGDRLLQGVAERLRSALRAGDTVARISGDEFVLILNDVADVDDVAQVTRKIMGQFAAPFPVTDSQLYVSASAGIALYPLDGRDPETLLKNADIAMYHAKQRGGSEFQFFTAEMNARAASRLKLETALRRALPNGELCLYYQPVMDPAGDAVLAAEALLRWRHPQRGLVAPGEFIGLAEETGVIVEIGEWVLAEACRQARTWQAQGFDGLRIAINLSSRQFQSHRLTDTVVRVLDQSGLAPADLDLELTESMLMHETDEVANTLQTLAALGVGFALDDFGTGYSSLAYLRRFPISTLKIDRSFTRDVTTDPDDAAIVQAITAMAHSLGLRVIAEGVETAEQLAFLRAHHCTGMQGYYFSAPLPPEEFAALLRQKQRRRASDQ